MKNSLKLLTGVLLAGTILFGCDKDEVDDDNAGKTNFLKIGTQEYDLSAGILENYGTDDDTTWHYGFNTDLLLYSAGLSMQTDEYGDWDLTGKGHGIYFEMFSTAGNALDNGDYVFSSAEPFPVKTFVYSGYSINYNTENDDVEKEGEIAGGKVSVSKNGSEYTITIDCIDDNGEKVTGFYKGTLRYFDWSEDFMSASLKSGKTKKNLFKK